MNGEGLVHAYLCDLSILPYPEQLKWKAHNVEPEGGLAKRAWERDFMAQWSTDYDPLLSLRQILQEFPNKDDKGMASALWALGTPPQGRDLNFLGYVVTSSKKVFEDQITALAQIIVEGLSRGEVNRLADELECRDKTLGSLKQLGKVLETLKVDPSFPSRSSIRSLRFKGYEAPRLPTAGHRRSRGINGRSSVSC